MRLRFVIPLLLATIWLHAPAVRADDGLSSSEFRDWMYFNNLGWTLLEQGNYSRAEVQFNSAIKAVRKEGLEDPRLLARSYYDLALVLYHQRRFAEAEPLVKWVSERAGEHPLVKPDAVFQTIYLLGLIHRIQNHYIEAEILFQRALAMQEVALGPDKPPEAPTYMNLACLARDRGKYGESEAFFQRTIAILEKDRPDQNIDLAETLEEYAILLRRINRESEALRLEDRADTVRHKLLLSARKPEAEAAGSGPRAPNPPASR